jgi:MFS family permease
LLLTWAGISCSIAPEALAAPWGRSLGTGTLGVGLLYAAAPGGVVVGLLLVGRSSAERGRRLLLPLAVLALAPLLVCLADPPLAVALGLVVLSGVGISYSLLARVAFVRAVTGPQRGRAFAVAAAGVTAGQGLGIALAGAAASLTSPSFAVGLLGALGLVLVAAVVVATAPSRAPGVAGGETSPAAATVPDGVASIGAWVPPDS